MEYIIILILSVLLFFLVKPISTKFKLPMPIFFLLFGILFGAYGIVNILGDGSITGLGLSNSLMVLSNLAILTLFLNSGLGLDLNSLKKSGKDALYLSIVPVHVEGIIMGIVTYVVMVLLFPQLGYSSIPLVGFLLIMVVYAICSPVLIIPSAMKLKALGAKSKILDNMIIASIGDPFTPFPYMILLLVLLIIKATGNSALSPLVAIIILLVGCVIIGVVGYVVGLIFGKILTKITSLEKTSQGIYMLLGLLFLILNVIVIDLTGPLKGLGIITSVFIGIGFNNTVSDELKKIILSKTNILFGLFLFPVVFIYVGTQTQIDKLLNPLLLIVLVFISLLGPIIKMLATKIYLEKNGYTKQESQYAQVGFALKGIIIINMSVLFGSLFKSIGLDVMLDFMYLLAAVSVILTIPLGIIKLTKIEDNWDELKDK